jgi:DNA-binding transcriptional LysR family regulator
MPSLQQLRTFLAVYRHGTLTAAAGTLHMSQPSVSAHIHDLELDAGTPLFIRHPRGVEPTPRGVALARAVAEPLETLAAIEAQLRAGKVEETVILGGPRDLISLRALPALATLLDSGLRLRLRTGLADELIASLASGEADIAIAAQQPRHADIVYESLFSETLVLVGVPSWRPRLDHAARQSHPEGELDEIPWLSLTEDLPFIAEYCRSSFDGRQPTSAAATLADMRGLARLAATGAGVTVLPDYVVEEELNSGALVILLHPADPPRQEIALAYHSASLGRPGVAAVREALLGATPGWRSSPPEKAPAQE